MGHPVLRCQARPIEASKIHSPALQQLIDDMIETMHEYHGTGLAGPQVHESIRLLVALLEDEPDAEGDATVIINPEIVSTGSATVEGWEGCLSIPEIRGMVPRQIAITVRGLDRNGQLMELHLKDFPSRVVQHETDHLDGILFFDRMDSLKTLTYMEEFTKYWAKSEDA